MRQMKSFSACTWNVDVNGVVACKYQISYKEVMLFSSCWGLLAPTAKGKCVFGSNSYQRDKRFFDGGVRGCK
jgi:hypothetical protein